MYKFKYVYHWSPSAYRDSIIEKGLLINREHEYTNLVTREKEIWQWPYIDAALDPFTALKYGTPTFSHDIPPLDLYQITLSENDSIKIRNDNTISIIRIQILNGIPCDRVKYLASREPN